MNLTDLPKWDKLSKEEKERIKKVYAPRLKQKYDLEGKLSVSKKELSHE